MIPAPTLFADGKTAVAVAEAPAVALLIGGYDGSGNYGDLVQLDAALALLAPLAPDLLLLPMLERVHLESHLELLPHFQRPHPHALFFDPGEGHEDDLQPVPAPPRASFAVCYLYGGGYLNPSWGDRKLALLAAAEELIDAGEVGDVCRIASGLQVDPGWISGLGEKDARRLRSFELLGARDRPSAEALAALVPAAETPDTADDAVGLLRQLPYAAATSGDGRLQVNLHVAEHPWVTGRPEKIAAFQAEVATELGRAAGLPVAVRPLIAFLDRVIDERPMVERLRAACAERGIEVAEPLVLRPANLATAAAELQPATVTVCCSYHVALTSLMLAVPTVLLRDNAYYEQKAAGLAESFGLAPAFEARPGDDPAAIAREIAAIALDPQAGPALREALALAAARVREQRQGAEGEILARIGAGAVAALGALGARLQERSAEPAALLAQLARSSDEGGAPEAVEEVEAAAAASPPADDGARQMLDEVLNSRSWKLTAPLRRTQGLFSRRR